MEAWMLWPWNWFSNPGPSGPGGDDPELYHGRKILIRYAEIGVNLDGEVFEGIYDKFIGSDMHAVKVITNSGKTMGSMVTTDEIIGKL